MKNISSAASSMLDTLDADQLRAATSRARDLLIVAPPGSGKTRVLTARLVLAALACAVLA